MGRLGGRVQLDIPIFSSLVFVTVDPHNLLGFTTDKICSLPEIKP